MFYYKICGLNVASSLKLPGVIETTVQSPDIHAYIRSAPVPFTLENSKTFGPNWMCTPDCFLLRVPNIARFLIVSGKELYVEADTDLQDAMPFLLGSAFGILLYQRRVIALHASAVSYVDKSFLFCGDSGIGKSTLSAALCLSGCGFVNDDLCAVSLNEQNKPVVKSDGRKLKLWRDAIEHFGVGFCEADLIRSQLNKYYIAPPHYQDLSVSLPISAIYILREYRPSMTEGIEALSLVDSAQLLSLQVYRHRLIKFMGLEAFHFSSISHLVSHTRIFRLTYRKDLNRLPELVGLLKRHWNDLASCQ